MAKGQRFFINERESRNLSRNSEYVLLPSAKEA
ncbi:hypothetical protein RA210_U290029 [Rubrivivax sp. A210]|nr:hypothetical protein RA210_U290029 [Rubrivivax sp. A210]